MSKVLDISSLGTSIDQNVKKLDQLIIQIEDLQAAVADVINLDTSLKGRGGDSIRAFFEECHSPFLSFSIRALSDYSDLIKIIKEGFLNFEPNERGHIKEQFLEEQLNDGLKKIENVTVELTAQTNSIINSISDIVSLPDINDDNVLQSISTAKKEKEQTVEELYETDYTFTSQLSSVSDNLIHMQDYLTTIKSLFKTKNISVGTYTSGAIKEFLSKSEPGSIEIRASRLLADVEERQKEELAGLIDAIQSGLIDSLVPVGVMAGFQKSGLLRIEYTRKKNHYIFKYNRKLSKFLKGRIGPHRTKSFITGLNRINKQHAKIEKNLKLQKRNVPHMTNYHDPRKLGKKLEGKSLKLITQNRPLHEFVKSKLFKNSGREMVIGKKAFKGVAARAGGVGAAIVSIGTAGLEINRKTKENANLYSGEKLYSENGKVVGEEVNKALGSTAGAVTGAYVGAAIGGVLAGPFAPFGAAAGAVIGGAIGSNVGEWASKYTKKWAGDVGKAAGKVVHSIKDNVSNTLDNIGKIFSWG